MSSTTLLLGYETLPKAQPVFSRPPVPVPVLDDSDQHLITIAPTGAGKGVSCIIPALLRWSGPAIVIDPKGENYAVTHATRMAMGQRICVLDPFRATGLHHVDRLNPLDLVDMTNPAGVDDVATIVGLLTTGMLSFKEPFWDERASALLVGLLAYELSSDDVGGPSLAALHHYINFPQPMLTALSADMAKHSLPEVKAAGNVLNPYLAPRTASSIISTAASHVSFLRNPAVQESVAKSTFPLKEVTDGKPLTIYIVLPPEKLATHARLLRLWVGTLLTAMQRRKARPAMPTLFLIDEAAQLGEMEQLRTAVTLMRGYGVKMWTFWQDLAQLERLYQDWTSILNNCGVQQVFGAATPFAAKQITDYLCGMVPRPVFGMPRDQQIVVREGDQPQLLTKVNYLRDVGLRRLAAPNPFFADQRAASGDVFKMKPAQKGDVNPMGLCCVTETD